MRALSSIPRAGRPTPRVSMALAAAAGTMLLGGCAYVDPLLDRVGIGETSQKMSSGAGATVAGTALARSLAPIPGTAVELPSASSAPEPAGQISTPGDPVPLLPGQPTAAASNTGDDGIDHVGRADADLESGCLDIGDSLIVARYKLTAAGYEETANGVFVRDSEIIQLNEQAPQDRLVIRGIGRQAPQHLFRRSPAAAIFCAPDLEQR